VVVFDPYATASPSAAAMQRSGRRAVITSLQAVQTAAGAAIYCRLSAPAVRDVCRDRELKQGLNSILWDGRNAAGARVPAGVYLVEARAWSADGGQSRLLTRLDIRP